MGFPPLTWEDKNGHIWTSLLPLGYQVTGNICTRCRVISDEPEGKEPCPGDIYTTCYLCNGTGVVRKPDTKDDIVVTDE
jgi:hypothetical protein